MDNPLDRELLHELSREYFELSADIRRLRQDLTDLRGQMAELKQVKEKTKPSPPPSLPRAERTEARTEESKPVNVEGIPESPLDRAIREESRLKEIMDRRGPGWLRPGRE